MLGRTPPCAMVTCDSSLLSSSSLRIASWMWRGVIRFFLLSRQAFPASSRISAQRYCCSGSSFVGGFDFGLAFQAAWVRTLWEPTP